MFTTLRHLARLFVIARTLARHGALFPLESAELLPAVTAAAKLFARKSSEGRPGERLARAFQELGPSFIKLGQVLSTRSDLLGEDVTEDLSQLQDHLPPFDGAEARAVVARELGQPLDRLFSEFDETPVAAASIAQVHFARTTEGEEVAVKVLRPNVEQAFERDLALLHWLARIVERTRPDLRRLKPLAVIFTFEETVKIEMDLRLEAAAAEELAENFAGDPTYRVPTVDWSRTARRVLTTERVIGIPIDEVEALQDAGHDPEDILREAAVVFFKQAFRDGFFHADQHPGNLFIDADGAIRPVDFGIMGRLDVRTRRYLGEMLSSFLARDYRRVAEIHFEAGYVPAHKSVEGFAQACRSIAEPIFDKPQNEISIARLLAHLFQVTEAFEMETQPQLLLLQKTMLVAEGVGRRLSPEVNMWTLAQPLIENWKAEYLGPEARLVAAVDEVAQGLGRLPRLVSDMEKSAQAIARSGLKLDPESFRTAADADGGRRSCTACPHIYLAIIAILVVTLLLV